MSTCARCGIVILPKAERMNELRIAHNGVVYGFEEFHPGCWEAEMRAEGRR